MAVATIRSLTARYLGLLAGVRFRTAKRSVPSRWILPAEGGRTRIRRHRRRVPAVWWKDRSLNDLDADENFVALPDATRVRVAARQRPAGPAASTRPHGHAGLP